MPAVGAAWSLPGWHPNGQVALHIFQETLTVWGVLLELVTVDLFEAFGGRA